jgi:hypothetical protein
MDPDALDRPMEKDTDNAALKKRRSDAAEQAEYSGGRPQGPVHGANVNSALNFPSFS